MIKRFGNLLRASWVEYERDRARYLAVAMIYYAGISLVPIIVLMLAALGLAVRWVSPAAIQAERDLLEIVEGYVGPEGLFAVKSLLDTLQQESYIAMLVGLGGIVFTSAVLFKQLRQAFRAIWRYEPVLTSGSIRTVVRTTLFEQAIAFVFVLGGGALLLAGLLLVASTRYLNQRLGHVLEGLPLLSQTTSWVVTATGGLVLAIMTFWPLFKFLPPVRIDWRAAWPAALLSAVVWVLAVEFLTIYGRWFGDSATGAIAGLFAALVWMNTVSQVLFFGAELCKVQHHATVTHSDAVNLRPPSASRAS